MDSCTCTCITLFLSSWKHLSDSLVRINNSLSIALCSLVSSPQNSSFSRFFLFLSLEAKMLQDVLSYNYKDQCLWNIVTSENCHTGLAEETFAALLWWICHLPDLHNDLCITSQRLLSICKWKCQLIAFVQHPDGVQHLCNWKNNQHHFGFFHILWCPFSIRCKVRVFTVMTAAYLWRHLFL